MYKNLIFTIVGMILIGVAFVDVSAAVLTLTLAVTGSVVALIGLWGLSEEPEANSYHLFD